MRQLFCLFLLILLAYGGSQLHRRKAKPSWLDGLFATGFIFCLIGYLLGPAGTGLITPTMRDELLPFVIFSLGWVGFLVGMQADLGLLNQVPRRYIGFTLGESGLTILAVSVTLALVFRTLGTSGPSLLLLSLVAGACAGGSSQALPALVTGERGNKETLLLRVATGLDDCPAMILVLVLSAYAGEGGHAFPLWTGMLWFGVTLALGLGFGLLFYLLLRPRAKFGETMAICLGVTILSSGAAAYLHLAVPGLAFIVGFFLANAPIVRKETFYNFLTAAERPVVLFMFLMAGAHLHFGSLWWLVPLIAYVGVRCAVKVSAGTLLARQLARDTDTSEKIGWGLIGPGPLSVAIALDYFCVQRAASAELLLWTVTAGALLGDLLVPFALRQLHIATAETI